jgi:hypothetical protein
LAQGAPTASPDEDQSRSGPLSLPGKDDSRQEQQGPCRLVQEPRQLGPAPIDFKAPAVISVLRGANRASPCAQRISAPTRVCPRTYRCSLASFALAPSIYRHLPMVEAIAPNQLWCIASDCLRTPANAVSTFAKNSCSTAAGNRDQYSLWIRARRYNLRPVPRRKDWRVRTASVSEATDWGGWRLRRPTTTRA